MNIAYEQCFVLMFQPTLYLQLSTWFYCHFSVYFLHC